MSKGRKAQREAELKASAVTEAVKVDSSPAPENTPLEGQDTPQAQMVVNNSDWPELFPIKDEALDEEEKQTFLDFAAIALHAQGVPLIKVWNSARNLWDSRVKDLDKQAKLKEVK